MISTKHIPRLYDAVATWPVNLRMKTWYAEKIVEVIVVIETFSRIRPALKV